MPWIRLSRSWYVKNPPMPIVSSRNVLLRIPENSGVKSSPLTLLVSDIALTPKLATSPGLSKGFAVIRSIVEPMPPLGLTALKVL